VWTSRTERERRARWLGLTNPVFFVRHGAGVSTEGAPANPGPSGEGSRRGQGPALRGEVVQVFQRPPGEDKVAQSQELEFAGEVGSFNLAVFAVSLASRAGIAAEKSVQTKGWRSPQILKNSPRASDGGKTVSTSERRKHGQIQNCTRGTLNGALFFREQAR